MKYGCVMPTFDTMAIRGDVGSCHDFPRLARESGFTFNLYRGRVDWKNIGNIDLDRLVRERDLETLQGVMSSVVSCSLDSEYDLKVLDPNFVKLFRLAQLSVDYLQYCRRYLDHCIIVMQEQLRVALKEIEQLQKEKRQKDEEMRHLQKKLKARVKASSGTCSLCGKAFVSADFLQAHCARRHPQHILPPGDKHQQEIERLQVQVTQLQERLHSTEDSLKHSQISTSPDILTIKTICQSELQKLKQQELLIQDLSLPQQPKTVARSLNEETKSLVESETHPVDQNIRVEPADTTPLSHTQVKAPIDSQNDNSLLLDCVRRQSEEITALRDQLLKQQLAQEEIWQKKLEQMERLHRADLDELRSSLQSTRGSGDHASSSDVKSDKASSLKRHLTHVQPQAWDVNIARCRTGNSSVQEEEEEKSKPVYILEAHSQIQVQTQEQLQQQPRRQTLQQESRRHSQHPILPRQSEQSHSYYDANDSSSSDSQIHQNSKTHATITGATLEPSPKMSRDFSAQPHSQSSVRSPSESSSLSQSDCSASDSEDPISGENTVSNDVHGESKFSSSSAYLKKTPAPTRSMYNQAGEVTESTDSATETTNGSDTQSHTSDAGLMPHHMVKKRGSSYQVELSPHILAGLKEDLQLLLERRLRELGVDPEWEGIPAATFRGNMATLKHHQNITAKSVKSYFQIRKHILHEAERRMKDETRETTSVMALSSGKKKVGEKRSLIARLKTSVKNRLYNNSNSSAECTSQKLNKRAKNGSQQSENIYTSDLTRPGDDKDSSHEYETLRDKPVSKEPTSLSTNKTIAQDTAKGSEPNQSIVRQLEPKMKKSVTPSSSSQLDKIIESQPSSSGISGRTYGGRSMYANLTQYEVAMENQGKDFRTSTPIEPAGSATVVDSSDNVRNVDVQRSFHSASNVGSVSDLESDLNDILENTPNVSMPLPVTRRRTSLSTAELLADVARLRQSNTTFPALHLAVKSNLKTSSSTGSITKKRVIFQDEKDGFNTIELGPAHGSSSPPPPQRSQSDNSIALSSSSTQSSNSHLPQPLSETATSATLVTISDSDWESDSASFNLPVERKTSKKDGSETNGGKNQLITLQQTPGSIGNRAHKELSVDSNKVSDIAKNIERQLQLRQGKPHHGVNVGGVLGSYQTSTLAAKSSVNNSKSGQENDINLSNCEAPASSSLHKSYSTVNDSFECLLDDFSSS